MTQKSKTAFFAGSFDPFTIGHKSIVERTLTIADRVVIGVGFNPGKCSADDVFERALRIQAIFANDPRVAVVHYSGLTTNIAKFHEADFLVRGVRSIADYEYELSLADANRDISGLETVLLPALPQYSFISSSMVRELASHGVDVSKYLP